jgi:NDP-sugar pyrophosphorylase family protein
LIDRLVSLFIRCGASSVHAIVNEEMREVQDYLRSRHYPVPFHLTVKSTPSSMHSFYELMPYLGEEVCLATVDTVFREDEFGRYVDAFRHEEEADGLMAVTGYVDDEKPLYVHTTGEDGMIDGFSDCPDGGSRFVSGGLYCLKRPAFDVLEEAVRQGVSRMRNYQRLLLERGLKLKAYPFSKIIDVDHAADIVKAEQFLNL